MQNYEFYGKMKVERKNKRKELKIIFQFFAFINLLWLVALFFKPFIQPLVESALPQNSILRF